MPGRRVSNPLALAVLALLFERPMHPYEISQLLRERRKHESIKLNYGSLYAVVETLEKRNWIAAQETIREGRRPERTVYTLTDEGRAELQSWLSELIRTPARDYTQFEAALALLPVLPPDQVLELLAERTQHLDENMVQARAENQQALAQGVDALFLIENDYRITLHQAERAWIGQLVQQIEEGAFTIVPRWRAWHDGGPHPSAPELD